MEEDPFDRWMREMMRLFKKVEEDLMRSFGEREEMDWKELEERFPEVETPSGVKIRGPFIQGYYFTIGPDGKPIVKHFGNVQKGEELREVEEKEVPIKVGAPEEEMVREPVLDVLDFGNELVVVAEMPGVDESQISVDADEKSVEVKGGLYSKKVSLPAKVDPKKMKKSYKNGILEIRLSKK